MTAAPRIAPLPRELLEQAADWWARIQDTEASPEEVSTWLEWLEADPKNREAFERIQELSLRLHASHEKATLHPRARRLPGPRTLKIAAAILLVLTGTLLVIRTQTTATAPPTFILSTPVAALEQAPLPDGSRISLGGATSIEAHYSPASRDIRLTEGEAYFEVRHESTLRPFIVNAGRVSIRAIGTAFNVRKTRDCVTVTVTEGRVHITRDAGKGAAFAGVPLAVTAGEQAVYDPASDRFHLATVDPHRALSWRERRLEFVDEPLDSVIDNINRYSPRRIEVRNVDLHEHSYTGTFHPDTLDEWLIALERAFPIAIDRGGETIVIQARP